MVYDISFCRFFWNGMRNLFMKLYKGHNVMKKTLLLAGVAGLFAVNAQAFEISDLRPYIGGDYNFVTTHHSDTDAGIFPNNYHSGTFVGGTKVLPYVGIEGFAEFAKYAHKNSTRTYYRAFGADIIGYLPLDCHKTVEVLGAIGLGRYYNKIKNPSGNKGIVDEYDWGYRLGAGLQYNINDNWAVRGMYHHVFFNKPHYVFKGFDAVSVGVRYTF